MISRSYYWTAEALEEYSDLSHIDCGNPNASIYLLDGEIDSVGLGHVYPEEVINSGRYEEIPAYRLMGCDFEGE